LQSPLPATSAYIATALVELLSITSVTYTNHLNFSIPQNYRNRRVLAHVEERAKPVLKTGV
jgi:hypothetical protein